MPESFRVSVVIPVYNAAPFISKAVHSALIQPEVAEVVMVEDCSPDNSLEICESLVKENPGKVRLFRHPGGVNKGAAASRNLGVIKSISTYVAFLDADDFYLDGRFRKASEILTADPSIDGVYDAIGLHIYSQLGADRYEKYKGKKMDPEKLLTVKEAVAPEKLFEALIQDNIGIFHANGITAKRKFLVDTGLFDEDLNIVEDTVLWLKLAYHGKLVAGELKRPVARQGIHDLNREPDMKPELLFQKYSRLFNYFLGKPVSAHVLRTLFIRMIAYHPRRKKIPASRLARKFQLFSVALIYIMKSPGLIFKLF